MGGGVEFRAKSTLNTPTTWTKVRVKMWGGRGRNQHFVSFRQIVLQCV